MSLPPDYVAQLHTLVDTLTAPVAATHQARIQCTRGCAGCCADGLTVFEVEADHIRRSAPAVLHGQQPHPPGACAMLDADGACRIYAARPYVCRTQGLPLRWAEADPDNADQAIELRDICPLNADGPPLDSLPDDQLWTLGPVEQRLAAAQAMHPAGHDARVPLRGLFHETPPVR